MTGEKGQQEDIKEEVLGDTADPIPSAIPKPMPAYDLNDVDNVAKEASQIPEDLRAHHRKMFALTRKLEGTQKRMKEINSKIYQEVSDEKTLGMPRFPDRKSIDRETNKRLEESSLWGKKKSEIYLKVDIARTDDDKKKFTSEKARDLETNRRLYDDKDIKEFNERIMKSVAEEVEPGKMRYANDKSREYEANRRLVELAEHKLLLEEEKKTIIQQQEVKQDIGYLNMRWEYIKLVAVFMQVKYRIL